VHILVSIDVKFLFITVLLDEPVLFIILGCALFST